MSIVISPGATDQSVELVAYNNTTFQPYTTIAHNTAGLSLWYRRVGAADVSITPVSIASLTSAHTDGGVKHMRNGVFTLMLPDLSVSVGVDRVVVGGSATSVIIVPQVIMLNFITAAGIQTEVQDGLQAYKLDKWMAASVSVNEIADSSGLARLVSKSATPSFSSFDNTTDSLEANRDNIGTTGAAMTIAAVTGAVGSVTGSVGSVTGAVGSVTGNVGGNVVGSVASVTGAVGSVTGNVGGNVVGSVASVTGAVGSVTGAVGSVTGNVGGNVAGSVASVTGAVGSVTGLTASDVGAIKTKADQLTFTKANELDVNIYSVNDVEVGGTGAEGDTWGPV